METKSMKLDQMPILAETEGFVMRGMHDGKIVAIYGEIAPNNDSVDQFREVLGDGLCSCPHWGYILEGSETIIDVDGNETVLNAGEMVYMSPGHASRTGDDGVRIVYFSPYEEIKPVLKKFAGIDI